MSNTHDTIKRSIGDNVEISTTGRIVGISETATGKLKYEIVGDLYTHCFVTDQAIINKEETCR